MPVKTKRARTKYNKRCLNRGIKYEKEVINAEAKYNKVLLSPTLENERHFSHRLGDKD